MSCRAVHCRVGCRAAMLAQTRKDLANGEGRAKGAVQSVLA